MSVFGTIKRALIGDPGDPAVLDHVPVTGAQDWREAKLVEAAKRHGRPFKCAGDGVPREVLLGSDTVSNVIVKGSA